MARWLRAVAAALLVGATACAEETTLAYHSDYFSFVGRDAQGFVAFALDSNRGRDGDTWQAEHFVILHDQNAGWIDVAGNGAYPNPGRKLTEIPDSPTFQFHRPSPGALVVASAVNALTLRVDGLEERLAIDDGERTIRLASGPATLTWRGREIPGRVIHEALVWRNWNRLTNTYLDTWDTFQGLYLVVWPEDEGAPLSDLYVRSTGSGDSQVVTGFTGEDWTLTVEDSDVGLGLYSWPTVWALGASGLEARLGVADGTTIATWITGGFRMATVSGEALIDGKAYRVYGLAELIK